MTPDEQQTLRWMLAVLWGLLLLTLTFHLALAEPITITSGNNYTYNYTNQTNETAFQDFLCLPNATAAVCAQTNVTIGLNPGETRVTFQNQCQLTATCAPATVIANGTCRIDTEIDPGETYRSNEASCNVEVTCDEADKCERLTSTVAYTKHYKITGDGQTINFEFDGKNQPFNRNSSSFNYEADITYECPVEVTKETFEGVDLLNLCKETNPYLLTWVDLAIKRGYDCQDQKTACEESVSSCEQQCTDRVGALNDRILTLQNQLNNTNSAFNTCLTQKQELESRQWVFGAGILLGSLYAGGMTVLAAILGYALWKGRRNKGDTE